MTGNQPIVLDNFVQEGKKSKLHGPTCYNVFRQWCQFYGAPESELYHSIAFNTVV